MSTITGLPGRFSSNGQAMYQLDGPIPGTYVVRDQHRDARGEYVDEPCCPYCRGRLFHRPGVVMYRVNWTPLDPRRRSEMIVVEIPSTHRTLVCGPCEQTFTVPA